MTNENISRREIASRKIPIFHKLASFLVRAGLHPNHISMLSAVFGILAGAFFSRAALWHPFWLYIVLAIVCIQLRLICNLIDGLMAVEGGMKTPTGELYNDVPDRISDVAIILGIGCGLKSFCTCSITLAWLAALGSVLTAYIRLLGASMGAGNIFAGPMAKQHRMFLICLGSIAWIVENTILHSAKSMFLVLILLIIGTLVTCLNRLRLISNKLNNG